MIFKNIYNGLICFNYEYITMVINCFADGLYHDFIMGKHGYTNVY